MKKKILTVGMTALMLATATAPLSAQAANIHTIKVGCIKNGTIVWGGECGELPNLNLGGLQIPGWGDIVIPEWNKPAVPDQETPSVPEVEKPETNIPDTNIPDTQNKSYAEQVVDLVNVERAKEGLAPLTMDATLNQAAVIRAREIQTSFSHTRPNGTNFGTAIKEVGGSYRTAGENIAWGQRTPEEVVKAWMNSAGHRKNIMSTGYSKIGVAYVQNAAGTAYWAQMFTN